MTRTRTSSFLARAMTRPVVAALAAATLAAGLSACAPLVVGGAMVGGVMVALDRRTSGAQVEDQAIELKAINRIKEVAGDRVHVNATSFNRMVLLTGEVPTEEDKQAIELAVSRIENVRSIVNELAVMEKSSLASRSSDVILAGKVKATLVDARDIQANAFKVVTERGIVYLMGIVTEREANRASDLARSVSGVRKVVRVFEIVSEEELARILPKTEPADTRTDPAAQ
ncbi:BON domain-containing protein [Caldimonas thermodepolymerans]|jgi:osmotically-inducible protein OsmY|uniref:Osmotically-inducible protein OsmY n=2 Tax=Caldimonas thermodepolymerans TaxID=215580 RepID=A0AA46DE24_9BURK|nr:BON domain-containing protein [Caldimonas thermodepolymerans]RDH99602.1 osmotically-inducible protein OsmY [Caldimonas thermodepolymerans]TCP07672.1 osmotically-inducible protein OsmY [Caldimonas thermodepolymerans]UZG47839.1 BON domain-containing protein [Caldimonas thermodepolymerans]